MEQRIRDLVTGELTLDYFMKRSAAGWKLASVEWTKDVQPAAGLPESAPASAPMGTDFATIPFGLRIAEGGQYLEENPLEATVLLLILEQIVKEKRLSEIAHRLNLLGHKTREGAPWSPTAVFNLLPRLVEVGPSILKSPAWTERRTSTN